MEKLLVLVALFYFASGLHLPSDFTTCKRAEKDVNKCIAEAMQSAIRKLENGKSELSFPSLNPLKIPSMTIGQGTGPVQVTQKFRNVELYGIPSISIDKVESDIQPTSLNLKIDGTIPELKLAADYDFDGRILVLPIIGSGKCTVTLKNMKVHLNVFDEAFEKGGKTYTEVKKFDVNLDPSKVEFHFDNLFNGDERLGAEMNKVLNENWKEVFEDVRSGYGESLGIVFQSLANLIHTRIPYNELFPL